MTTFVNSLRLSYYNWMLSKVGIPINSPHSMVLQALDNTEFSYSIPMDENRESDGLNLRYIFGYENNINQDVISESLCNRGCSMLEMMVSLAMREETILNVISGQDRTPQWFWIMIRNLGLDHLDDNHFNINIFNDIIIKTLNHEYRFDGYDGGLYPINNPPQDLRTVDIWTQMCWFVERNNIH